MFTQDYRITDFVSFQSVGLKNVDKAVFSYRNLIIGKNGSGKTRFLKVLEQEKKRNETKKEIVITLYFSEIQAFYDSLQSKPKEDAAKAPSQEIYPYDLLLEQEECSFYDFLKVMENDRAAFLENILYVLSMKGTRKNNDAKKTLEEMNYLLTEFIGKRIWIDRDTNRILIEKIEHDEAVRALPLKEALSEFSPGELMLFYLCVFLVVIKRNHPQGVVLIMDEPELHLHPHALVRMIQILKESENVVELWIASHSLFLVPLFAFEEIIFMEQNTVYSRNSRIYRDLYDSLVGLENINLFEFLKSLDSWQYYQFIAECFCLPEPVGKANVKDEQFCKLLNCIKRGIEYKSIQVLDYGAGKCRIWECMQLLPDSEPGKNKVVYTAYEPYPEVVERRPFQLYTDFSNLRKDQRKFHAVVLMNVLHEIEGCEWEQTFQNIESVLTDDGVLIFLEVLSLTKGEQPYGNNGYLVLQDEQVKILFDDSNIINMRMNPKEKSNCWMVTKKQVGNVTGETVRKSIVSLQASSYRALEKEFKKRIEYAHGTADSQEKQMAARKYAFLSQQYINASLTVSEVENREIRRSGAARRITDNQERSGDQSIKVTGVKDKFILRPNI